MAPLTHDRTEVNYIPKDLMANTMSLVKNDNKESDKV